MPPAEAAVFEDALAGVEAGRAGGFGFVVGVDRVGQADELRGQAPTSWSPTWGTCWRGGDPERPRIDASVFPTEPWLVREASLDLDVLAQSRVGVRPANGHIGLRGNLDEGEPYGLPGTYLNGVYELRPLPYAEAGYGYPESGQTIINVTNGKLLRLLVDDEPFDVRYGDAAPPRARARLPRPGRCGDVEWVSPAGQVDAGHVGPAGVLHPAGGGRHQLRGRGRRRPGPRRRAVRAGGQRAPADARPGPPGGRGAESPLVPEDHGTRGDAPSWSTARGQRPAGGGGDGPRRRRAPTAPT